MNHAFLRALSLGSLALIASLLFSSCTVDQNAALFTSGSATKKKTEKVSTGGEKSWAEKMKEAREEREKEKATAEAKKEKELAAKKKADEKKAAEAGPSFAERMAAAREEREKQRAIADKEKAAELAAKKKADEAEARKLAIAKKKEAAEKELLAARKAKEVAAKEAAEKKEREKRLAVKAAEAKKREEARLLAKKKAEAEKEARRLARAGNSDSTAREVAAVAERRSSGGGFFSRLAVGTPNEYKSEGHDIFVNQRLLGSLSPANAKIEVDLSEQRARIYKTGAGGRQLVIDTAISSGKSGHTTPTGTFRIKEKLVHKRSTLYGTWMSSSGATVRSSGDSRQRPSGGSRFVGAEMPYWMRINGGIGMHIGYVPNYPASHGCIRVPSAIQPLIYSKVGVGTSVTVKH